MKVMRFLRTPLFASPTDAAMAQSAHLRFFLSEFLGSAAALALVLTVWDSFSPAESASEPPLRRLVYLAVWAGIMATWKLWFSRRGSASPAGGSSESS